MSDRKYRQSGYQDSDGGRRPSAKQAPRQRPEGPRGRGLGAPTATVSKCARCGTQLEKTATPVDNCSKCGSDLHTCTNCRHFDSSAPNECRKPDVSRVASKAKNNECELFEPKLVQVFAADSKASGSDPSGAKAAFDDLFNF